MNIAGVRNHEGHGSSAQKSIWHSLKMLSDFNEVKADIDGFNENDIIDGQRGFYHFIKTLYEDMYADPAKFAVPVTEYDNYIKNIDTGAAFIKAHRNDTIESKLRNTFQHAIEFYAKYFYELGLLAEGICADTFSLIVTKSKYDNLLSSLGRLYIYKTNGQRFVALESSGITINEMNGACYISCSTYPKMFLGLWVLCKAPENKYKYMNYLRLDYKNLFKSMPGIEDIKFTMAVEHADCIDSFIKLFGNEKIKYKVKPLRSITSAHGWKVEFMLNGKNVFGFFCEPDYLAFYIYFNHTKNISQMAQRLENTDFELYSWFCGKFPVMLCKCRNNKIVVFGSEKRRICGLSNRAEIINPVDDDVKKSILILKIFHGIV